ncbi:hypothetical protein [Flavobacterium sp. LAR06]|uniref:hypothetical protein n=1 Tax=Flavobacterium sp. LAR06 TaxID=3064897 RepID=UPI0035BFE81C
MKTDCTFIFKQFLFLIIIFLTANGIAQQSISKQTEGLQNKWNFLLDPYVMFPNINGTTAVSTLPEVQVDANPGDIFDQLNMGAMLYFEASDDRWSFSSDLLYMNLKQGVKSGAIIQSGEIEAKQLAWELTAMRRVLPRLDAGIGLRLNSMAIGIDLIRNTVGGSTTISKSAVETWVDPILVVRFKSDPSTNFLYQFRGDIGGFGIGSDFAWQLQAYVGYRFSKLFQITGGYRIIGMDYDKGNGEDRFMYKMDTFGPVVRFGFSL